MGRFLSLLGSAAFAAVQVYELYQRYQAQKRAEREEAIGIELLELNRAKVYDLARIADAQEKQALFAEEVKKTLEGSVDALAARLNTPEFIEMLRAYMTPKGPERPEPADN